MNIFLILFFLQNILPCLEGAGAGWEGEGGDEEGDAEGVDEPVT